VRRIKSTSQQSHYKFIDVILEADKDLLFGRESDFSVSGAGYIMGACLAVEVVFIFRTVVSDWF
jgi:hypothetical protein